MMTYLLAKYAVFFALAALSGFFFGRWLMRRSFVDVSEGYEDLREAANRSDVAQWNQLWNRLDAIPEPQAVNLSGVFERLDGLAYAVTNLPQPEPTNMTLFESKLEQLSTHVDAIPAPVSPKEVDLAPIDQRLGEIEIQLGAISTRLANPPRTPVATIETTRAEPATLTSAQYGEKDNLRLISGVGPKLERLLNQNGVFYFWQIADWAPQDTRTFDERLDTFKGRIDRDNWVSQAKRLSEASDSARRPAAMRKTA